MRVKPSCGRRLFVCFYNTFQTAINMNAQQHHSIFIVGIFPHANASMLAFLWSFVCDSTCWTECTDPGRTTDPRVPNVFRLHQRCVLLPLIGQEGHNSPRQHVYFLLCLTADNLLSSFNCLSCSFWIRWLSLDWEQVNKMVLIWILQLVKPYFHPCSFCLQIFSFLGWLFCFQHRHFLFLI